MHNPQHARTEKSGLRARIDAMFRGDRINVTETRDVQHVALQRQKGSHYETQYRSAEGSRIEAGTAAQESRI
ncbi:MAG: hypothetical protein WCF73_03635 [Candidatus Sulfotelmatobacter sp.]